MQRNVTAGSILLGATLLFASGCSSDSPSDGAGGAGGSNSGSGGSGTGGRGGSGGGSGGSSGTGGSANTGSGGSGSGGSGSGGAASGGTSGTGGATGGAGGSSGADGNSSPDGSVSETGSGSMTMSFFVTSVPAGMGGDLGGLAGADAKCKQLATAVSADLGAKTWRAYLSTATENAKDRIGAGPWRNAKGEIIANTVAQLHDQGETGMLNAIWPIGAGAVAKILDEKGMPVPSGGPQRHDILTGTNMAGMVDGTNTCSNWTSMTGTSTVGHSNRAGGQRPPSWTTAHTSGCAPGQATGSVGAGGGQGSVYCFAID